VNPKRTGISRRLRIPEKFSFRPSERARELMQADLDRRAAAGELLPHGVFTLILNRSLEISLSNPSRSNGPAA
jgi:hypothetical protein